MLILSSVVITTNGKKMAVGHIDTPAISIPDVLDAIILSRHNKEDFKAIRNDEFYKLLNVGHYN